MGDLKKKKPSVLINQGQTATVEQEKFNGEEKTVECLREYLKKFYEMQINKQEGNGEE